MLLAREEDIRGEQDRASEKIQAHFSEPEREEEGEEVGGGGEKKEQESSNTFSSEILKPLH